MKTLQDQLIDHISILDHYCSKSLSKKVSKFNSKHKQPLQQDRYYSLEDVHSYLKIEVIKSVTNKYNKSGFPLDHSPLKYIKSIFENGIKGYLMEQGHYVKCQTEYINDIKGRMIMESECHNYKLGVHIDGMSYIDARELLKEAFDGSIKHDAVFYMVQQKYSYNKIAKLLKVSVDYVRKIWNESENMLSDLLGLNHCLPQKNKAVIKIEVPKKTNDGKLTYKEKKRIYQRNYYLKNKVRREK